MENNNHIAKFTRFPEGMQLIKPTDCFAIRLQKEKIVYREVAGQKLILRLIRVTDVQQPQAKYPLIVFVQGSAWRKQDLDDHVLEFAAIAKQGYQIALVEHRTVEQALFPAQVVDVKQAVRYLVAHADEYAIDRQNIFLWGDSSGAHTILMCYATAQTGQCDESTTPFPDIRGYIDFCGPTDFLAMMQEPSEMDHWSDESPEARILGVSLLQSPERAAQARVMNYIDSTKKPPLLIVHGNMDRTIPFQQSVHLYEHVRAHQLDVAFYGIDGADHSGAKMWSKETIRVVLTFLQTHRNVIE